MVIDGYGAERLMYTCPSFDDAEAAVNSVGDPVTIRDAPLDEPGNYIWRNSDYAINVSAYGAKRGDPDFGSSKQKAKNLSFSIQTADMLRPSEHIGVLDSFFVAAPSDSPFYSPGIPNRGVFALAGIVTTNPGEHPHARHGGAINILWGDGHGEAFRVDDIWRPYETLGDWNTDVNVDKIPNRWDTRK
jgi:prepilin-type processing-associated H-X9-DG protein